MSRATKILGFSVPPAVAKQVEALARQERRTKSELFREMVRVYRRFRELRDREETLWVTNLVREARAEQMRIPVAAGEILEESRRLAEKGEEKARGLGLKTGLKGAVNLIHDRRRGRRTA